MNNAIRRNSVTKWHPTLRSIASLHHGAAWKTGGKPPYSRTSAVRRGVRRLAAVFLRCTLVQRSTSPGDCGCAPPLHQECSVERRRQAAALQELGGASWSTAACRRFSSFHLGAMLYVPRRLQLRATAAPRCSVGRRRLAAALQDAAGECPNSRRRDKDDPRFSRL